MSTSRKIGIARVSVLVYRWPCSAILHSQPDFRASSPSPDECASSPGFLFEARQPGRPWYQAMSNVSDHPNRESCHVLESVPALLNSKDGTVSPADRPEEDRASETSLVVGEPTRDSQCFPHSQPDKQCGSNASESGSGRVQLAHPSGPASASDTTVQGDLASKHIHSQQWGECAHTVSTNQNDKDLD